MPNIIPFPRRRRWTGPADYGRGEPARIRSTRWTRFAPLWLGAILLGLGYGSGTFSTGPQQALGAASLAGPVRATFGYCYIGGGTNCVVDGDTFWINGEKVRIAGIDAPETHPSRCAEEARLGRAATQKLHELLNSGAVTMTNIDRDRDRYGRLLRNVEVNGQDIGEAMVGAGVAREYGSGRRSWC